MAMINKYGGTQDLGFNWSSQDLLGPVTNTTFNSTTFESGDILDQYINATGASSKIPGLSNATGGNTWDSILQKISELFTQYMQKFSSSFGSNSEGGESGFNFSNLGQTNDVSAYATTNDDDSNIVGGKVDLKEKHSPPAPPPVVAAETTPVPANKRNDNVDAGEFSTEPQVGKLSEAETKAESQKLVQHLMKDFDLTKEQAAGIAGNLMHESDGLNANMNQYGFANGGGPGAPSSDMNQGYGWAQWSYGRKQEYLNFCEQQKLNPASPAANYAFLKHELQTTESGTIAAVKGTSTPKDAAITFRRVYERAENPVDSSRISAAEKVESWLV